MKAIYKAANYFIGFYCVAGIVACYAMPEEKWRIPFLVILGIVGTLGVDYHIGLMKS